MTSVSPRGGPANGVGRSQRVHTSPADGDGVEVARVPWRSPRARLDRDEKPVASARPSQSARSCPFHSVIIGESGVALARGTHADHGRASAILIIRHVIGRNRCIWVIEPSPASRVVNFKQPLAAARPEGHISPQRHLPVRYAPAAHGQRRRARGSQPGPRLYVVCGNDKKRAARGAVGPALAQEPAAAAGRSYRCGVLLGAGARLLEHPPTWHVGRTDVGRFGGVDDGLRVR